MAHVHTQPFMRLFMTASQELNNTQRFVQFNSMPASQGSSIEELLSSDDTNKYEGFSFNEGGLYMISYRLEVENDNNSTFIGLSNGDTNDIQNVQYYIRYADVNSMRIISGSDVIAVVQGDKVRLNHYLNTGGIQTVAKYCTFACCRLSSTDPYGNLRHIVTTDIYSFTKFSATMSTNTVNGRYYICAYHMTRSDTEAVHAQNGKTIYAYSDTWDGNDFHVEGPFANSGNPDEATWIFEKQSENSWTITSTENSPEHITNLPQHIFENMKIEIMDGFDQTVKIIHTGSGSDVYWTYSDVDPNNPNNWANVNAVSDFSDAAVWTLGNIKESEI